MLKSLRMKLNKTQRQVAQDVGVSDSTISMWENGQRKPPLTKIESLAKALKVSKAKILECFE